MANERDDQEQDEEQDEKEERDALIKSLKAYRQMFFAYIPKGSLGKLVVRLSKRERDQAAKEVKKTLGGDAPVMGTCLGSLHGKVFKLDKKPADAEKLGLSMQRVIKRAPGCTSTQTFS